MARPGFWLWAEQCLFSVCKDPNAQSFLLDMKLCILVFSKSKKSEKKHILHILSLSIGQSNKYWTAQWYQIFDGDVRHAFVSSRILKHKVYRHVHWTEFALTDNLFSCCPVWKHCDVSANNFRTFLISLILNMLFLFRTKNNVSNSNAHAGKEYSMKTLLQYPLWCLEPKVCCPDRNKCVWVFDSQIYLGTC